MVLLISVATNVLIVRNALKRKKVFAPIAKESLLEDPDVI
jgi:hypothetical protein